MRRLLLVLLVVATPAGADEGLARALPAFRLVDPLGRPFTDAELRERGAVVVVTAPTHSQGDAQYAWSAALRSLEVAADGPRLVLLEDMSQSWFRPLVLAKMRESYGPKARLVLLLDEGGLVRKALGVKEATTLALAIAPGGAIVAHETLAGTPVRAQRLLEAVVGAGKPTPRP
jgi:hypothetical protein